MTVLGGLLKVSKSGSRVVGNKLRVGTRGFTGSTQVGGFCKVWRHRIRGRVRRRDLQQQGQSDINETLQLRITNADRTDRDVSRVDVGRVGR